MRAAIYQKAAAVPNPATGPDATAGSGVKTSAELVGRVRDGARSGAYPPRSSASIAAGSDICAQSRSPDPVGTQASAASRQSRGGVRLDACSISSRCSGGNPLGSARSTAPPNSAASGGTIQQPGQDGDLPDPRRSQRSEPQPDLRPPALTEHVDARNPHRLEVGGDPRCQVRRSQAPDPAARIAEARQVHGDRAPLRAPGPFEQWGEHARGQPQIVQTEQRYGVVRRAGVAKREAGAAGLERLGGPRTGRPAGREAAPELGQGAALQTPAQRPGQRQAHDRAQIDQRGPTFGRGDHIGRTAQVGVEQSARRQRVENVLKLVEESVVESPRVTAPTEGHAGDVLHGEGELVDAPQGSRDAGHAAEPLQDPQFPASQPGRQQGSHRPDAPRIVLDDAALRVSPGQEQDIGVGETAAVQYADSRAPELVPQRLQARPQRSAMATTPRPTASAVPISSLSANRTRLQSRPFSAASPNGT